MFLTLQAVVLLVLSLNERCPHLSTKLPHEARKKFTNALVDSNVAQVSNISLSFPAYQGTNRGSSQDKLAFLLQETLDLPLETKQKSNTEASFFLPHVIPPPSTCGNSPREFIISTDC